MAEASEVEELQSGLGSPEKDTGRSGGSGLEVTSSLVHHTWESQPALPGPSV